MAVWRMKYILIEYEELPVINGVHITDIYKCTYDTRGVKGASIKEENAFHYYMCKPYFSSDKRQIVEKLPDDLQDIFDNPPSATYLKDGKKVKQSLTKVESIFFRTQSSGNGSFIDSSITVRGLQSNGTARWLSVTRTWTDELSGLTDKLFSLLNKKHEITLLEKSRYTYYPSTFLGKVDGFLYPDPVCFGWRWIYGIPYVSYDNRDNIRIFDVKLQCHMYLNKVEECYAGEEYIHLDFGKYDGFCKIRRWNQNKEHAYIKYIVESTDNGVNIRQEDSKRSSKFEEYDLRGFYRIVKIINRYL